MSAAFQIEQTGPGRLEVRGALSFATAAEALREGIKLIGTAPECTVGLGGVAEADSAGLAVLIEWLASARVRGAQLRYEAIPGQILAVARISEVQRLLGAE
ncbi:MAG TPA: STAS domain-containing protein [Steroidobacteraceae bacterium]|nr:STAS domain-containing protein [Steroidobacteraceae bacterium]